MALRKTKIGLWTGMVLFALVLSLGPTTVIHGENQTEENAEMLKFLYVEPKELASESGQLIVVEFADSLGNPNNVQLVYRDDAGTEQRMKATEAAGGYAAFLVKGSGIGGNSLTGMEATVNGQVQSINLSTYKTASDTKATRITDTDTESKSRSTASSITPGQKVAVEGVTANDASGIVGALAQAEGLAGGSGKSRSKGNVNVVLDPGHGGSDPGATRTWNGISYIEKDIVLKISRYTKEELETYEGVTVYMTRNTDSYLTLKERVDYAAAKDASVIVSQHINSTSSWDAQYSVSGAMVFLSAGQYRGDLAKESRSIANNILKQLEGAGFRNMGLIINLSTDNTRYPNGALADYYGIIERSVRAGFAGMIVEHGFVNNPNDCVNFYGSNSKIKKMGVADATAIAQYYGLKKKGSAEPPAPTTGWSTEGNYKVYLRADGTKATDWQNISGIYYYFNSKGYMLTGKQTISQKVHYLSSTGAAMSGTVKIGSSYCVLDNKGFIITNPAGSWRQAGNGSWYYYKQDGTMARGWILSKSEKYYLNSKGIMATGWNKIGGKYYYLNSSGSMNAGTIKVGSTTYYLNSNGTAKTGYQTINGKKVFLDTKGRIVKEKWMQDGNGWWYRYADGSYPKKQWKVIDGKRYYFKASGYMATGWLKLGNIYYYLQSSGEIGKGWIASGSSWYYVDSKGKMLTKSWVKDIGKWYYVQSDGAMVANKSLKIAGKTYRFDSSGRCLNK